MLFFTSKMERVLNRCLRKADRVELKYQDGVQTHPSKLLQIGKDFIVLQGFSDTLRQDSLEVLIEPAGLCLSTRVTHTRRDQRGVLLLYCAMPGSFGERRKGARFFVYPNSTLCLLHQTQTYELPLWDISEQGLTFVDLTSQKYQPDQEISGPAIHVAGHSEIIDLQVMNRRQKLHGLDQLELVGCRFLKPSADVSGLIENARRMDGI